ncbi:MAG: AEC family transporter [Lachnospiraceae bacterium]|nr:AEC family transporter [Lachnospiraceae bacterium]
MRQIIPVLEMVLPVIVMLFLGYLCRAKNLVTKEGLAGIKSVISNITLPVVLFKAFYTTDYSLRSVLGFVIIFTSCVLALLAGYALNRFVAQSKLMPYLLSGFEVGMLGYALYGLLAGTDKLSYMASVDLGQVLFVYTVYLTLLKNATGQKTDVKGILLSMIKNPAFQGVAIGIIVGITGLGGFISASPVGGIFSEIIEMITLPTAGMILIIVGYELSMRRDLVGPVVKTIAFRVAVMAVLLCISAFIMFSLLPFDKNLFMAMVLLFSLPAPFIIPLYADVESEGVYISTTLSMNTLVTIFIFILLSVYTLS